MNDKVISLQDLRGQTAPEKILQLPPGQAEKIFNRLSLRQQVETVLRTPWDRRLDVILLARDSRGLVQALPDEEVYWSIKERGAADSLAIISRTSFDQFQYLIDIDCWNRGRIDYRNLSTWYALLARCNEDKVIEWFDCADDEFLVASLKEFVVPYKIQHETDISEEYDHMPDFSPDGTYFFKLKDPEARQFIIPFLNVLYNDNKERFYSIVEGVIWDFALEAQDEALRWRTSRIAGKGFPDFDEALEVYQLISDREAVIAVQKADEAFARTPAGPYEQETAPLRYGFGPERMPSFLFSVIQGLSGQDLLDKLQQYIVNVTNKIIIADSLEIRSLDDMLRAFKKAGGYINIGLEMCSDGNVDRARSQLTAIHPETLFKIGYSRVVKQRNRLETEKNNVWSGHAQCFYSFFDTPWGEALEGLERKRPLFFTGLTTPGQIEFKDFEQVAEVTAVEQVVDITVQVQKILFDGLGLEPRRLFSEVVSAAGLNDAEELKASAVLLTVLANHVLSGRMQLTPLTARALQEFLLTAFGGEAEGRPHAAVAAMQNAAMSMLRSNVYGGAAPPPAAQAFVAACLKMFSEEFKTLAHKKKIDKRYVHGLLLKNTEQD